jgi:outer membrane immunogenic protein
MIMNQLSIAALILVAIPVLFIVFSRSFFRDRSGLGGKMIRTLLLSTALTVVAAGAAFAADLPNTKEAPAYAPPPPPEFTWTGFYVGINGGYGGNKINYDDNDPGHLNPGEAPGGPLHGVHNDTTQLTSSGFLAGGTVGMNYQFPSSNFVVGFEGDFDWSNIRGQWSEGSSSGTSSYSEGYGSRLNWLATARARLGYAVLTPIGNILPYVTGGGAFGNVTDYRYSWGSAGEGCDGTTLTGCTNASHTFAGWTAGGGLEYAITQNLTLKAEYLYVDLGTHSILSDGKYSPADPRFNSDPGQQLTEHFTANIVRVGLNWKFDWFAPPPAPVVAKY